MNLNQFCLSIDQSVPQHWRIPLELLVICTPYVTRALHALWNRRGLLAALAGIFFGTNTPAPSPVVSNDTGAKPAIGVKLMCLVLVPWLALVPILAGCGSPLAATNTAVTTTQITVEAAMTAYSAYLKAHPPGTPGALTDAQRAQVRTAYIRYQNCMVEVIDAEEVVIASTSTNAAAGTNSTADNLHAVALTASSQALTDLVTLLQSFGVKIS